MYSVYKRFLKRLFTLRARLQRHICCKSLHLQYKKCVLQLGKK